MSDGLMIIPGMKITLNQRITKCVLRAEIVVAEYVEKRQLKVGYESTLQISKSMSHRRLRSILSKDLMDFTFIFE